MVRGRTTFGPAPASPECFICLTIFMRLIFRFLLSACSRSKWNRIYLRLIMRFPLHITTDAIKHQVSNGLKGNKRYPMVLMLEPLYTCNLACLGCALERHTGKLEDRMPIEDCLRAVDESRAPIVSPCGGEPTIYPELKELIEGIISRKRHIYLCTNALLLDTKLFGKVDPHKRLTLNVHLDGMQKTHDMVCDRAGVFDKAIEMIKQAKRLGYHVTTNTTVFKETDMTEIEDLCALVSS